ncbi:MAG: hypothetical protein P4L84_32160 [Isosphaeraceae bacterium]|nr:hypothetical protein [Isosphaeraceae bacterium]
MNSDRFRNKGGSRPGRGGRLSALAFVLLAGFSCSVAQASQIRAGVAKVDITDRSTLPVNDPLYAKALVLKDDATTVVLITVDAVALGEIGRIGNGFLADVRARLRDELNVPPSSVLINASHCHGVVRTDLAPLVVQAVKEARAGMVPVTVGAGVGREDRIMENRRLRLKDGSEMDMRRAYSLPPDEDVAGVGPVDPQIGVLRLDRQDGRTLAVVYNFACHPIQGVPSGGNTADFPGFASKAIEETLGGGALALFVQGCAGDINPARYKDVQNPRDAEPLGNALGLGVLRALRTIPTKEGGALKIVAEVLTLPRGADLERRSAAIQAEQARLLRSLKGTTLNFKTFLPLFVQHKMSADFPSADAQRYLHETSLGRDDQKKHDAENRANLDAYIQNIHVMEQLTRLNTNLDLLTMHQAQNAAAGKATIDVEVAGVRVGDFVLVTFPGELTVEVGLNIKKAAPHPRTFVAGYTNGYIYYTPTERQRNNPGYAQEDCDCLVAPAWQKLFEDKVRAILKTL